MNEMTPQQQTSLPLPVEEKKKKKGFKSFFRVLLILLTVIALLAAFLYGISVGGKYAARVNRFDPDSIPFTEYIVSALQRIGKINYSLTITEEQINSVIISYEDNFKPLKNVYADPGDGYLVLSGQVTAESLKEFSEINIPDLVWLFLPSVLNIKAEVVPSVTDGETKVDILSLTIINAENGAEILSLSNFDSLFQELVEDVIEDSLPENITLESLSVTEEGIKISGTASVLNQ